MAAPSSNCSRESSIDRSDGYSVASTVLVNDTSLNAGGVEASKRLQIVLKRLSPQIIKKYKAIDFVKPARKRKRVSALEYIVQKIDGSHLIDDRVFYKVLWRGFSPDDCTYEPECNLYNSYFLLRKYYEYTFGAADVSIVNALIKEFKECVELPNPSGVAVEDFLVLNNYTFGDLTKPTFKNKIEADIFDVAMCVACTENHKTHEDPDLRKRGVVLATILELIQRRHQQLLSLAATERELNRMESTRLYLENNVDLDVFPTNFQYSAAMVIGEGVPPCEEPVIYCECDTCDIKSKCCGTLNDSEMMYRFNGTLRSYDNKAIFECNKNCSCPVTCRNRVVQRGRQIELVIFKTKFRGWGVRAKRRIPAGTFVCEYLGKLMAVEDSTSTAGPYVFALDFDDENEAYCVDATSVGNVGRFINHGCQPNAIVRSVWVDIQLRELPKLAIFTHKEVRGGEEILFDYLGGSKVSRMGMTRMVSEKNHISNSQAPLKGSRCFCGADNCKMFLLNEVNL